MPLRGMGFSVAGLGKVSKRLFDLRNVASDVTPEAVNWGGISWSINGSGTGYEQQITGISEPIVLEVSLADTLDFFYYRSAPTQLHTQTLNVSLSVGGILYVDVPNPGAGGTYITNASGSYTFTVNPDDYVFFSGGLEDVPDTVEILITVKNTSDNDTVLDTFISETYCFLTTAVVEYKGLLDNGPELTAMRLLRDRYSTIQGYDYLISEYYENAPKIVEAIGDSPEVYEEIYRSVKMCQAFVENENWQAAHDEYFRMYNDLKARYLK